MVNRRHFLGVLCTPGLFGLLPASVHTPVYTGRVQGFWRPTIGETYHIDRFSLEGREEYEGRQRILAIDGACGITIPHVLRIFSVTESGEIRVWLSHNGSSWYRTFIVADQKISSALTLHQQKSLEHLQLQQPLGFNGGYQMAESGESHYSFYRRSI